MSLIYQFVPPFLASPSIYLSHSLILLHSPIPRQQVCLGTADAALKEQYSTLSMKQWSQAKKSTTKVLENTLIVKKI